MTTPTSCGETGSEVLWLCALAVRLVARCIRGLVKSRVKYIVRVATTSVVAGAALHWRQLTKCSIDAKPMQKNNVCVHTDQQSAYAVMHVQLQGTPVVQTG